MENENEVVTKTVRIPFKMNQDISKIASEEHRSINSMFLKIIDEFVKKRNIVS